MIILCGPDRCGKSTVGDYIKNRLPNHTLVHHTNPYKIGREPFEYFDNSIRTARLNTIFDRFWWCEDVYGHTFRGGSGLTDAEFNILDLAAESRGAQIIVMTDDPAAIASRWDENEMFPPDKIADLVERYSAFHNRTARSRLNAATFKLRDLITVDGEATAALESIIAAERKNNAALDTLPLPCTGLGSTQPERFIFIRKRLAPSVYPFHGEHDADSLWAILQSAGVDPTMGYYTYLGQHVKGLIKDLAPKAVICWDDESIDMTLDLFDANADDPGFDSDSVWSVAHLRKEHERVELVKTALHCFKHIHIQPFESAGCVDNIFRIAS